MLTPVSGCTWIFYELCQGSKPQRPLVHLLQTSPNIFTHVRTNLDPTHPIARKQCAAFSCSLPRFQPQVSSDPTLDDNQLSRSLSRPPGAKPKGLAVMRVATVVELSEGPGW